MEKSATESKKSDFDNLFEELLGETDRNNIANDIKLYQKNNPKNVVFVGEIYNGEMSVWKGQIDLTIFENGLKDISLTLNTLLNVVDVNENKIVVSFNKGKTILSLEYKNLIRRNMETRKLTNIYSKK